MRSEARDPSIESVSMGRPTFLLLLPLAFLLLLLLLLLSTNQSGKKDVPRVFVALMANRSNNSPILVYKKVSAAFLRFNRRAGVNKCGSSTLQLLMKRLKVENRFVLCLFFLQDSSCSKLS